MLAKEKKRTEEEEKYLAEAIAREVSKESAPEQKTEFKTQQLRAKEIYDKALSMAKAGQVNSAAHVLLEATLVFPDNVDLYSLLGLCFIELNEWNGAYNSLKKVQILNPSLLATIYKKPILLGPIYASYGQVFENVCIIAPNYGIIANDNQIKINNCEILGGIGVQFNGMGIIITNSFFNTSLCVEYTQSSVQMGNVFVNNKFYGEWSNVE